MPAPVILGEDPRLAQLLRRLPDLGVPVLPLDYERIFRVFAPGRRLEWIAARELLITLLAKDAEQRSLIRREFRRRIPPVEEKAEEAPPADDDTAQETTAADAAADQADPHSPPAPTPSKPVILTTPRERRWPIWRLALGIAVFAVIAALLTA